MAKEWRWCRRCFCRLVFDDYQWRWVADDDPDYGWYCTPKFLHDPTRETPNLWKESYL